MMRSAKPLASLSVQPDGVRSAAWSPSPMVRISFGLHAASAAGFVVEPTAWPWYVMALAANHALLGAAGLWPRSTLLGPKQVRLPPPAARQRQVALTFDDGPDPEVTPGVLDLLDCYDAKASFFFVGRKAAAFPRIVREAIRRGHAVENHSDRHLRWFACLPAGPLAREIRMAQARLSDISGVAPRFFRPPMGLRSPLLDPVLVAIGLSHVSWTRRGYDTMVAGSQVVLRRLCLGLAAGDILLLHDCRSAGAKSGPLTVLEVLPPLLSRITAANLKSVTLASVVNTE